MMMELFGLDSAISASGKTLNITTRRRLYWRSFQALVRLSGVRHTGRITLRNEQGFTAVELMVSIAIIGVLSALAAPALTTMIQTQRVKSATFDLYAALTYARSEAIKRNAVVTITPRTGGFANGYDMLDQNNLVIRSGLGSPAVTIVRCTTFDCNSTATAGPLAFDGYGRLTPSASYQLQLIPTQSSNTPKRCLVISPTGRPSIRVDNDHDGNCING